MQNKTTKKVGRKEEACLNNCLVRLSLSLCVSLYGARRLHPFVCVRACVWGLDLCSNWCTPSPWCTRCNGWRSPRRPWFRSPFTKKRRKKGLASSRQSTIETNSTLSISTLRRLPQLLLPPLRLLFPLGVHRSPADPLPIPWISSPFRPFLNNKKKTKKKQNQNQTKQKKKKTAGYFRLFFFFSFHRYSLSYIHFVLLLLLLLLSLTFFIFSFVHIFVQIDAGTWRNGRPSRHVCVFLLASALWNVASLPFFLSLYLSPVLFLIFFFSSQHNQNNRGTQSEILAPHVLLDVLAITRERCLCVMCTAVDTEIRWRPFQIACVQC